MKKFVRYYLILLKAQLKRVETWGALVLILLIVLIFKGMTPPDIYNLKLALYCEDEDVVDDFLEILSTNESIFEFVVYDDLSKMKSDVLKGRVECGFDINPDYQKALTKGRQGNIITYYCSSFSSKGEVAKETMYSAVLKIESALYLKDNLEELYRKPSEGLEEALSDLQQQYLTGDELFKIHEKYVYDASDLSDASGASNLSEDSDAVAGYLLKDHAKEDAYEKAAEQKISKNASPVQGTIALILFLLIFLCVGDLRTRERTGYPAILRKGERMLFSFEGVLAAVTIPGLVGFVMMLLVGESRWHSSWTVVDALCLFGILLLFVCYSFLFCYGICALVRKESRYFSTIIILLLLTVVLCPIFVDASRYVRILKTFRLVLPVGLFLM